MNVREQFRKIRWDTTTHTSMPMRVGIMSSSHNLVGNTYANAGYFTKQDARMNTQHLEKLFSKYAMNYPYKTSAKVLALRSNPATMGQAAILEKLELERWREKGKQWCIRNERKEFNEYIGTHNMHGIKGDKVPRGNAKLSSSWVKAGTGNNFKGDTITLNLGGKQYEYGCNLKELAKNPSIGRTVAKLRNSPAGTTIGGLRKLY